MRSLPLVLLACLSLAFVTTASAGDAHIYESSIEIPQPLATSSDPGQAIVRTKVRFSSIDMVCLHVFFDATDPLDPGEELRFTPNSWLERTSGVTAGPGFFNVGSEPQYSRTLCSAQFPGLPPDEFNAEFLDGKQVLKLQAIGSVLISRIDVEIFGSTADE